MSKDIYLNVPSAGSLSRREAIEEARGRDWHEHSHAGITYYNGGQVYLDIADFTDAERNILKHHLIK